MNKNFLLRSVSAFLLLCGYSAHGQFVFTNGNNLLNTTDFSSGCSVAVIDWDSDGLDDIVRLKDGHNVYVEIQRPDQTFETRMLGDFGGGSAWSMGVADIDNNGYKDIVAYVGPIRLMMMNSTGTAGTITSIPGTGFFAQNLTFGDFNNDGWIDLFACDDNAPSHIFMNDGAGVLSASSTVINFDVTNSDDSGNYGSVYTDFDNDGDLDLYIAKCRQGVNNPADERRIDVLFVNNGDGTYTESAAQYGVANGWQTWTASFGDIDNDGDLDLMATNHDYVSQIFENDGSGHYTDISATTGFNTNSLTPIESVMEDFNNDGFIDILVGGSSSVMWRNNGNKTFTAVWNEGMESFGLGDLNHDGKIDIYGSYAGIYTNPSGIDDVLWLNNSPDNNHYITLELKGVETNPGAIGARAMVYGAWGTQLREVRSGESYGTVNSAMLHFGLGSSVAIDSIVISWPSGESLTINTPLADQFLKITEGQCVGPQFTLSTVGATTICEGDPVMISTTLAQPELYTFLWSNGQTTPSITVTSAGDYNVLVSLAGNECQTTSGNVSVELFPDETPAIAASGDLAFCNGSSVTLSGPTSASGYLWNTGETTQSITVSETGSYFLTVDGVCQAYSSSTLEISVTTPDAPTADNVVITAPGNATINAAGDFILWYDQAVGGNIIGGGNSFVTPTVNTSATFYAASSTTTGGDEFSGGLPAHSGVSDYSGDPNTNAVMQFDVIESCILKSVMVFTEYPGNRKFELRNSDGVLLNSITVNITGDMEVMLNFELMPGTGYTLGTDENINLLIPDVNATGPALKRNNTAVAYPYSVGNLVSITGAETGTPQPTFYFYFYNWKVETEAVTCLSDRVPVTVTVDDQTGINELNSSIKVYPNPAKEFVSIRTNDSKAFITLYDQAGRTVLSRQTGSNGILSLDGLASGLYNLKVSTANDNQVMKLIVE